MYAQNCTAWEDGSLGSGDLSGEQVLAYVASTTTPVDDPSDVASDFTEHNFFSFFRLQLGICAIFLLRLVLERCC